MAQVIGSEKPVCGTEWAKMEASWATAIEMNVKANILRSPGITDLLQTKTVLTVYNEQNTSTTACLPTYYVVCMVHYGIEAQASCSFRKVIIAFKCLHAGKWPL